MYPKNMFFTSESVTEGHPDKFCDQISDAVLDKCLKHDPMSRVACETYVTMGMLIVGGEVTTKALSDVAKVVREVGNEIGYNSIKYGFDINTAAITMCILAIFLGAILSGFAAAALMKRFGAPSGGPAAAQTAGGR